MNNASELPEQVKKLKVAFLARHAFLAGIIDRSYDSFGSQWADRFNDVLEKTIPDDEVLARAVSGYADFAIDAMRLQHRFDLDGVYSAKTYEEAAQEVYQNEKYMMELYLPGILLSHFLWPHHYRQSVFFRTTFLEDMRSKGGNFADVGIGTGYYSARCLEARPDIVGTGYDMSPYSKRHSLDMMKAYGWESRYNVNLGDITVDTPKDVADWLVSVEVLEHLEDPAGFLKALRLMLRDGGKAFISAALNSANADHIYLYRTPGEVIEQLTAAGFHLEQYHSAFAYAPKTKGQLVPEITAFVVS
jgi:2-polyprenyl-3-methyl-5-hydroxy-6-metoxy-1,4-benzoquinol methylase